MTDQTHGDRLRGETSGSSQRPAQAPAGPYLTFDLAAELDRLRREESYRGGDRNAKTLVSERDLRIVLTAMKAGAQLKEHRAPGPISIQPLLGRLRLHASGETIELGVGQVLALGRNVPHDVEAIGESAFLLSIGWPDGPGDRG